MNNPDQNATISAQNGASGGMTGDTNARNLTEIGKRPEIRPAVTGSTPLKRGFDSGRSDSEASSNTENSQTNEPRKRARRRKRGKNSKQVNAQASSAPPPSPKDNKHLSGDARPATKLSNRRRRTRRKKQGAGPELFVQSGFQAGFQAGSQADLQAPSQAGQPDTTAAANAPLDQTGRPQQSRGNGAHRSNAPRSNHGQTQPLTADSSLYAALDLGTNNCRLLVAAPTRSGQFRVVDAFSRIVRLGEGLSASGRLSDLAMDRSIEALKICRDKLAAKNIRRSRLIATEACRSAENGLEFLHRVRADTGLELEIVDRQTEARLAVSGCGTLVARETDAVVLFDIGGGSSEIALIDVSQRRSPRLAEHIIAWTSLPVGVVTLAERFGGRNVTGESFAAMVDHVSDLLTHFSERDQLGALAHSSRFHLLGTSGTVTTLAGIHLGLERYDRRRVDGMWMGTDDVTSMTSQLLSWDFETRVANPCIGADRADLVLAGCAILDAIRIVWPSEKLLVADRGLREGILTELMSRDGAWRHNRPAAPKNRHMS